MHPILARPARVAAYVAVWLPLGGSLAALLAMQGVLPWPAAIAFAMPIAVAYGFLCLSAWYAAQGLPVDRFDPVRVTITAMAAASISSAVWLLIARGWLSVVSATGRWPAARGAFRGSAPTLFGFGLLLYLLAIAVSYVAAAFEKSRAAERRGLEMQVLAREAELRALRAQIDPHFLFNSLQSISALTAVDPAAARRMCLLLADFLRDTLALGARERIPLSSELAIAKRFLAIEQVRFGDRLRVEVTADAAEACLVAPLVLQPLVENAVTHGIAHVLEGGAVRIAAERGAAVLRIRVDNPCDRDRPAGRGTGMGLANVRARLRTLYGNDAALRTEEKDGRFTANIELPIETVGK
ncbi:MAG: sensor histidine kinase [Acidobacteria bacterium]|nr:MAG: sensor histidine kinase [Acidobacteriota bacterium]